MYPYEGQRKLKDDLRILINQKLRQLGVFPTNITPELKNRINRLQEEDLELRQSKKFTKEKGIEILNEIDLINEGLANLPSTKKEETEEIEFRKRKSTKTKSKRKLCKCKK
jgi:hypothetical protein